MYLFMNSWTRLVKLTVTAIPIASISFNRLMRMALNVSISKLQRTFSFTAFNNKTALLPRQVIGNVINRINVVSSKLIGAIMKESVGNNVLPFSFLNFDRLPDVIFRDKILAVVDFGNINYINQDF